MPKPKSLAGWRQGIYFRIYFNVGLPGLEYEFGSPILSPVLAITSVVNKVTVIHSKRMPVAVQHVKVIAV